MGAARPFLISSFAKTTVCSAAAARLSLGTQAQGTASLPLPHSHTDHQGSATSSWELKSHFFFQEESLGPEQHCNRCLNHFSPAHSVIPLKAHAFHFPTTDGSIWLSPRLFSHFLSKGFQAGFSFSVCGRSAQERSSPSRRPWQGDPSSSLPQEELQAEGAAGPLKGRTS